MDAFKELIETFGSRLKSRIVGSIIVSFLVINWKVLFYILFEPVSSLEKFAYFDANTTRQSLYLFPIVVGTVVGALMPWVSLLGVKISSMPDRMYKEERNIAHLRNVRHKQDFQEELERSKAIKEKALIEAAKRDEEVKAIADPEIRVRLEQDIVSTRETNSTKFDAGTNTESKSQNKIEFQAIGAPFSLHEFQARIEKITNDQFKLKDIAYQIEENKSLLNESLKRTINELDNNLEMSEASGNQTKSISLRVKKVEVTHEVSEEIQSFEREIITMNDQYQNLEQEKKSLLSEFEKFYEK